MNKQRKIKFRIWSNDSKKFFATESLTDIFENPNLLV